MKNIYKSIIAIIFTIATMGSSSAQTYSIIPDDTINVTGIMEDLETLSIQQLNISNSIITLEWQKVSENVPLLWETNVCDNVICYSSLINGGVMNPVNPGDYGFLLVHITPHVNFGTATIRYAVWDVAFPLLKDTMTFMLTVNAPTGISKGKDEAAFAFYPNPANIFLKISNNTNASFNYKICDITGSKIEMGESVSQLLNINTNNYKNGIYYLDIISENEFNTNSKFVIIH